MGGRDKPGAPTRQGRVSTKAETNTKRFLSKPGRIRNLKGFNLNQKGFNLNLKRLQSKPEKASI